MSDFEITVIVIAIGLTAYNAYNFFIKGDK